MSDLDRVAASGGVIDEWRRWNQGQCGIYALALIQLRPALRFGSVCDAEGAYHHFAHDDDFAYDSAGRHLLPYLGLFPMPGDFMLLDGCAAFYGLPEDMESEHGAESDIADAIDHIRRHNLLGEP